VNNPGYGDVRVFVWSNKMTEIPEACRDKAQLTRLPPHELMAELHRRGYQRVYVDGGQTIQACLREDFIDELVVTRLPVLIGDGLPLFGALPGDLHWEPVATKVYPQEHGLVKSVYRRRMVP
jgi:dihydrofolate reductase